MIITKEPTQAVTTIALRICDEHGATIGAIAPVVVPGLRSVTPFQPVTHYVGWAQDWSADRLDGEYVPVCLGVSDEYHELISEIKKRADEAQG